MSESNNKLSQLIESTRQDAQAQLARTQALASRTPPQARGKQIFTLLLVAVFAAVLLYQFPRFSEPYTWPDPANNPALAEADLIEVVGLIEAYRISQGQYPAALSQLALPEGLAAIVASTVPLYRPSEGSYTLEWTLPPWRAAYDSQSGKVSVEPAGKQ